MTVKVRLFAFYADRLGTSEMDVELPEGSTAGDVLGMVRHLPGGSALPDTPLMAVNRTYATRETMVSHGDELAIIPPVAGG